ncbi:MAG: PTS sugar transporter subunit IIA [Bacillota bacterium]|nr:PTS sugar transporter subunit IIA [Bacillota bacterium]
MRVRPASGGGRTLAWRGGLTDVVGVVLVSHGPLAEGLKGAAEMIVGPQERLAAVGMDAAADVEALRAEIEGALARVSEGADGGLILADMLGGSPSNASGYAALAGTPVICGVNLPMLLEVLMRRESAGPLELAAAALEAGRQGVTDLGARLSGGAG